MAITKTIPDFDITKWRWERTDSGVNPVWITLSEASKSCYELVKCSYQSNCTRRCKCKIQIDKEIFWLCQVTSIKKTMLHSTWLNMLEEVKYASGDPCKIRWNNIIRPEKSLEKIFVLHEFSGSVYYLFPCLRNLKEKLIRCNT